MPDNPSLADLGEWELIRRLGVFAPPGQFGDDGALVAEQGGGNLVINTDVLVEELHFSEATTEPADVGWRAAVANLSDLAAMGCREVLGLTVGLVAPPSTSWRWVEEVYRGLGEALAAYGGVILGGDCSGGAQRILAVTAIGRLEAQPIRRRDGRPGDWLVCTGHHGLSRLGLALLQGSVMNEQLSEALILRAITAHRRPVPRMDAVSALVESRPEVIPWRVGGCDSSDGLAAAVGAIATASGCGATLDRGGLPLDPAMADLPEAEAWCLEGGEDFELVMALEPSWAQALMGQLPGSSRIGSLVAEPVGELRWGETGGEGSGNRPTTGGNLLSTGGYRHFG